MLRPSAILVWLSVRKWQHLTETAEATALHVGVICYGTATGWIRWFAMNVPGTANMIVVVISRGTATGCVGHFASNFASTANIVAAVIRRGTATFVPWTEIKGVCHRKRRDSHQEQYQREFRNTIPETCYKTRKILSEIEQFLSEKLHSN